MDWLLCAMLEHKYHEYPNVQTESEYACGLMKCQQYKSALKLFEDLKHSGYKIQLPYLDENINFCEKPLPWSSEAKDHHGGSWLHNFFLVRFGGRRMVAISSDTYLEANAMLRAMERKS